MVLYGDSLLVNNANKCSSMVIQYKGACAKQSLREMRIVVPSDTPGINHPYGLALDHSYLYVTNQARMRRTPAAPPVGCMRDKE